MSKNEKLYKKLTNTKKNSWHEYSTKEHKTIHTFAEEYKTFLQKSKTERMCIANIKELLTKAGFKNIVKITSLKKGDKFYKEVKGKAIFAGIVGKQPESLKIIGSHVDSPRLDLKPNPVYEDSELSLLKTHYYGGVKKYHWVNTPLELHGTIITKKGKKVDIHIGDKQTDPKFIIPDLLPHLARNQMERKADKLIEGEELNIIVGSIPVKDEKIKEQIKFSVLQHLYETYDIHEEDFNCAELQLVPATNPIDIGFDRGLIGAYGHDDKVCAYTSLRALLDTKKPTQTAIAMFVDKEEIGSMGDTGAASFILEQFTYDYTQCLQNTKKNHTINHRKMLENAVSISADVTAAMDPNFKDVNDSQNVSYLGKGVSIEKYGGGGGKYSTNDAHAEFMGYLRNLLAKHNIPWQTGELGKVDMGGGGTIAMFMSRYGMDCVDAGPAVLGMHSPCEVVSKADIYSAYKLYKVFFETE